MTSKSSEQAMNKRAQKEMNAVRKGFEEWLSEYGFTLRQGRGYEYAVTFPGFGAAELKLDAHLDDPRKGVWVMCRFRDVKRAVEVYGDRRANDPDHLYAEVLCPFGGKFNFYHRGMDTIHFITAIESGIKHLKEAA